MTSQHRRLAQVLLVEIFGVARVMTLGPIVTRINALARNSVLQLLYLIGKADVLVGKGRVIYGLFH